MLQFSGPILLGRTPLLTPVWICAEPVQPRVLCLQCPPELTSAPLPRRVYPLDVFTQSNQLRSRLPFARLNKRSSLSFLHSLAHARALCPHPPAQHIPQSPPLHPAQLMNNGANWSGWVG